MTTRKTLRLLFAALAICSLAYSCKDDDEDETLPSLEGTVKFDLPEFIYQNTKLTLTPKGAIHPEGKDVGWAWKVTPGMSGYDTTKFQNASGNGAYTHFFTDSLTTYTVSASAFADGYYSSYVSRYVTAVRGGITGGSIGGINETEKDFWFTDPRDLTRYLAGEIGSLVWMKENLAYEKLGMGFRDSDVTSHVFGRFYSQDEALKACPEGWRLPTDREFMEILQPYSDQTLYEHELWKGVSGNLMVYSTFNGMDLWEFWPNVNVTNKTGFNAIPVGYANLPGKTFSGLYDCAVFWTADKLDGKGLYRYFVDNEPDVYAGTADPESFGASVRCVREK